MPRPSTRSRAVIPLASVPRVRDVISTCPPSWVRSPPMSQVPSEPAGIVVVVDGHAASGFSNDPRYPLARTVSMHRLATLFQFAFGAAVTMLAAIAMRD